MVLISAGCNVYLTGLLSALCEGLEAPVRQTIISVVGVLVICIGIAVLQFSEDDQSEGPRCPRFVRPNWRCAVQG